MKRYLVLSLIAFISYSLVAPLLKLAMVAIPSSTAVFLSNTVMFIILTGILVYEGISPFEYLNHSKMPYIILWGIALAVGLLAYYRALELGPVSVVVPIYGLFIPVSSIMGVLILEESVTTRKVASIALAVLAITLMSI